VLLMFAVLPAAAYRWGGSTRFDRAVKETSADLLHRRSRENRLSMTEIDAIQRAVRRGEALSDPRLRAIAHEVSEATLLSQQAFAHGRAGRSMIILRAVAASLLLVVAVVQFSHHDVPGGAVLVIEAIAFPIAALLVARRQSRNAAAAVRLNAPGGSQGQSGLSG